jgi:hypothetical protein
LPRQARDTNIRKVHESKTARGGFAGGVGALITSPTCPDAACIAKGTRADLQLFHASAASGFTDWSSLGTLDPNAAGYTSLLPATPLMPQQDGEEASRINSRSTAAVTSEEEEEEDYLVLYESMSTGARCAKIGQKRCSDVALITFALKTTDGFGNATTTTTTPLPSHAAHQR